METNPWLRPLLILLVAIAALYLMNLAWQLGMRFADVILLFFLAWFIAFTLSPVARFLTRYRGIPRVLVVTVIYLGLVLILVGISISVLPPMISQLSQLGNTLPSYVLRMPEFLNDAEQWLHEHGIMVEVSSLYQTQDLVQRAESLGSIIAQTALSFAQGIASTILSLVIVLVLSFYITLDGSRISRRMTKLLPERYQDEVRFFLTSIDHTFGGYMRGAVILGIIYGTGTGIIMWSQGLSFTLPVSVFAGIMMLIPFIGTALAIVPPIIIALFTGSVTKVVIVLVALLILQQIVLHIISPKVMSHNVGMHPLLVILALMLGAKLAGIWGIIFGVPILAVLNSMASFFYQRATKGKQAT